MSNTHPLSVTPVVDIDAEAFGAVAQGVARIPLRANLSWTLAGNVISAACQWGMIIAIAKVGNAAMVGQYALALAIVAPIVLFSNLQLRAIQATDARGDFSFGHYLAVRIAATAAAAAVLLSLVSFYKYASPTALSIIALTLSKSIEGISDIFFGFLQQQERMDRIAKSTIIRMPLSLGVMALAVYVTGSVFAGILAMAAVHLFVLAAYDIPVSARLRREIDASDTKRGPISFRPEWRLSRMIALIWITVPLGAAMLLISLQTNVPRYVIARFLGERQVGIFAALAYFLAAGNIVTEALGQCLMPRLARFYDSCDWKGLWRLLGWLSLLGGVAGLVTLAVGKLAGAELLAIFYRPEYARYLDVFLVLLLSAAPTYIGSFFGYAMTATRLLWIQLPISLLSTGLIAICCLWLVPSKGLIGAAEAVLVVSVVRLVLSGAVLANASRSARQAI